MFIVISISTYAYKWFYIYIYIYMQRERGWLFVFYGISTFVGYLMPNLFLYK